MANLVSWRLHVRQGKQRGWERPSAASSPCPPQAWWRFCLRVAGRRSRRRRPGRGRGRDGGVIAGGLGVVHHGVGGTDNGLNAAAVLGEGSQAEGAGERQRESLGGEEALPAKLLP